MDEQAMRGKKAAGMRGRTRSIAFVGLTIALMGVSAWVAIPFGPVLLTLQMFALMFALLALTPRECLAAIGGGASGGRLAGRRAWAVDLAACLVFIVVTYTCGCVQYAAVVGVDLAAAFAVTIAPFAIPDLVKAVAAVACARAVTRAVGRR